MPHSILVAASEPSIGHGIVSSIRDLGRALAGPFSSNTEALDWLGVGWVDGAILDILLEDGSALQLADALHRDRIPYVFFADFDARRRAIRSEFPGRLGACQEAYLLELLTALECASSTRRTVHA
jgi:DNA-binding NarL/FixJ family response regulator